MTLNPSAKKSLRKHSTAKPGFNEALRVLKAVHDETGPAADRALAIQGTAMIEHALEIEIKSHFKRNDDETLQRIFGARENGPLCSLGARIQIAYALGGFGPATFNDLKTVVEIRNAFAHSAKPIGFDFPAIKTLCQSLHLHETLSVPDPASGRDRFRGFVAKIVTALTIVVTVDDDEGEDSFKIERVPLP